MKNRTSDLWSYRLCFDRDREYWNKFYTKNITTEPSLFARFVLNYMEEGRSLLDIGCGNGRDSIFFACNGLLVTGIDASNVAIENLQKNGMVDKVAFVCDDFVNSDVYKRKFYYCYSRFSLHAINLEQQETLLKNLYFCLENNGKLFVEARSVNDKLYGKGKYIEKDAYVHDGHFRRFIRLEELEKAMIRIGFRIISSEEKINFAPFGNENPPIIRMVAMK